MAGGLSRRRSETSWISGVGSACSAFMRQAARVVESWSSEERDAVLYSASALFAICSAEASNISLYRQWGELAVGPYAAAAVFSALLARAHRRKEAAVAEAGGEDHTVTPAQRQWHWTSTRTLIFLMVLVGATLLPLSLEVLWRTSTNGTAHVQPEVPVVEQAGVRVAHHQDPYQNVGPGSHLQPPPGQPKYDIYDPYLPLMSAFGLARSTHAPPRLTDARVAFSLITMLVVVAALALCRGPTGPRVLTLQSMTVLPTAALPLATGGDDLPVAAFMLLGLVLMQRRRPLGAGIALGIAASMKITAWPLAAVAFLAARDREGQRGRRPALWVVAGM
ncbi:MAG: glycosyltransferase family 87 protein, partial [Acidimicrobiales bacterium]